MDIQKVKHLHLEEAKKKPNTNYKYMVSEKIDGWYVYCDYDKYLGWGAIMSSAHRSIPSMLHCKRAYFEKLHNPRSNCRLIMEAYIPHTPFHVLNGVFNRSVGTYDALDVHFKIHDLVYFDDLGQTALRRYENLLSLEDKGCFKATRLDVLSLLAVTNSRKEWLTSFDTITYNGGEGIILKQTDSFYQPGKRNSSLMKIKLEATFDLLCVAVYETFGEKGNRNLNLKLVRKSGVEVHVRVGKHEDIAKIDADESCVVGCVMEIKCMKELEDGKLREPRLVGARYEKTKEEID